MSFEKFTLPEAGTKFQVDKGSGTIDALVKIGFKDGEKLTKKERAKRYKELDQETKLKLQLLAEAVQGDGYVYSGKEYVVPTIEILDKTENVSNKDEDSTKNNDKTSLTDKTNNSSDKSNDLENTDDNNTENEEVKGEVFKQTIDTFSPNLTITNTYRRIINNTDNSDTEEKEDTVVETPSNSNEAIDCSETVIDSNNPENKIIEDNTENNTIEDRVEIETEVYKVQSQPTDTMQEVVYRAALNDQIGTSNLQDIQDYKNKLSSSDREFFNEITKQMEEKYPNFTAGQIVEFTEDMVIKLQAISLPGQGINSAAVENLDVSRLGEYTIFPGDKMIHTLARVGIGDFVGNYSRDEISLKINELPFENKKTLNRIAARFNDANMTNTSGKIKIEKSIVEKIRVLMQTKETTYTNEEFIQDLKAQIMQGPSLEIDKIPSNFDYNQLSNFRVEDLRITALSQQEINHLVTKLNTSNLQNLTIKNCGIEDMSFITSAPQLKVLDLSNNNISRISSVRRLAELESLNLANNNVSNISDLVANNNLRNLDISNNPIQDFTPLLEIESLEKVTISSNQPLVIEEGAYKFQIIKK